MFCGPLCWCISALLKGVLGDYCTKPANKPASHSTARLSCQLNLASGTFWNTPPQGSAVWGCVPVSLSGNPGAQMFGYHSCSIPRPGEQLPHPQSLWGWSGGGICGSWVHLCPHPAGKELLPQLPPALALQLLLGVQAAEPGTPAGPPVQTAGERLLWVFPVPKAFIC